MEPRPNLHGFFKGTTNCLSALLAAERHDELLALLEMGPYKMWHYRQYGVQALAVLGKKAEAIRYTEEGRGLNNGPVAIARACEEVLLSSGFAAAKHAKLFDEAIALANRNPCSPQTLTRAARDFEEKRPEFAIEAGMAALHWLVEGYGYDISDLDVLNAYAHTMTAAENAGCAAQTQKRIHDLVARESFGERFVTKVLRRHLGLSY